MGITPKPDRDLKQVIDALTKRVTALEQANPLQGGVVISGGGLTGIDPTTSNEVFFLGLGPFEDGSGRQQMETLLFRDDGSLAFGVADRGTTDGHTHLQNVFIKDRAGNFVIADDTVSGIGLANPHVVAGTLQNTNTSTWPATNASSFTSIADTYVEMQNAAFAWIIQLLADSGTTAQFELLVNGTQIGTTQTVTAGFGSWSVTNQVLPGPPALGSFMHIDLQAKVTAGAGSARARCFFVSGWQS